jgi:hypothetical protein
MIQVDSKNTVQPKPVTLTISTTPDLVDAGAYFTLQAAVTCDPPQDLRTRHLSIRDPNGNEISQLVLTEFEEGKNCGSAVLIAPAEPGPAQLMVWLTADPDINLAEDICAPVRLDIPAHASSVVVWGVPPAIMMGENFTFYAGLRCSANCSLKERPLEVRDEKNRILATATTGATWRDTQALHYTKITLTAPKSLGTASWKVYAPSTGLEVPHSIGVTIFPVTTVLAGQYKISIKSINSVTKQVIPGAQVVAHPFRAMTDSNGNATLSLPGGEYRVSVKAVGHEPYIVEGMVKNEMKIIATLEPEVETTEFEVEQWE